MHEYKVTGLNFGLGFGKATTRTARIDEHVRELGSQGRRLIDVKKNVALELPSEWHFFWEKKSPEGEQATRLVAAGAHGLEDRDRLPGTAYRFSEETLPPPRALGHYPDMTKLCRLPAGSPLFAVLLALVLLVALGAGPARAVSQLVLPAGSPGATFNAPGELVVHVPSGTLSVPALDLRAGVTLTLNPSYGNVVLDVAGTLNLCTTVSLPSCLPFGDGQPDTGADPFHVTVLGPLTGPLELYAGTTLILTPEPIPEPGTAWMMALGLAGLARWGRRR